MVTTHKEYEQHLAIQYAKDNLLDPATEVLLLHGTNEPWSFVLEALIRGHIKKKRPYLTADYIMGKLEQCVGPHPESLLDDFNRAIYNALIIQKPAGATQ